MTSGAARQTYNQYTDGVIPPEKKVNLISIQMEAFADLSLYDIDGLSPEVYRDFHELQAESYSGTLITDIFAGGHHRDRVGCPHRGQPARGF